MKIIKLSRGIDGAVREAVAVLKQEGTIVYPTETVYGLGVNATQEETVEQVFKIKERPPSKPLPILARNMRWVKELAVIHPKLEKPLEIIWGLTKKENRPGPVTVILPKKNVIPWNVTAKGPSVGIRIDRHPFTDALLGKYGYPITATSANVSGLPATGNAGEIIKMFKDRVWKPDLIIDAGSLPPAKPSTILDLTKIKPKIIRAGMAEEKKLMEILNIK